MVLAVHACKEIITILVTVAVMFSQTTYSVNEDTGSVQIGLILSNSSSADITVQLYNTDGSATGEYCSIFINY